MNEKLLLDLGFTNGEIKVYTTLLKTGETTTGKIVKEAQISAGKIYQILDKLIKKGLVGYVIKDKTKYFSAASPNRILDWMQEKEKKLQKQEEELRKELPALLQLHQEKKNTYESTLYVGYKGIKTAIYEALEEMNPEDEILSMGIQPNTRDEKYNLMWMPFHKERSKKNIQCRLIFSARTPHLTIFEDLTCTEIRILEGITPSALGIWGDRVLLFVWSEHASCQSIRHPEIATSFRTFFENLWEQAK